MRRRRRLLVVEHRPRVHRLCSATWRIDDVYVFFAVRGARTRIFSGNALVVVLL